MGSAVRGIKLAAIALIIFAAITTYHFRDSIIRHGPAPAPPASTQSGVVFYDRLRAQRDHYNVVMDVGSLLRCSVYDMSGNLIYRFPSGYCHIFKDGSFAKAMEDLRFYDRSGFEKWSVPGHGDFHHEFDANWDESEIFTLDHGKIRRNSEWVKDEIVRGFTTDGKEIFTWRASDHWDQIEKAAKERVEWQRVGENLLARTHFNSVQSLPPNALETNYPEFRRGNIMVACFHNKLIFILDRKTGDIVWSYQFSNLKNEELKNQYSVIGPHTVRMLPDGKLILFVNTYSYPWTNRVFSTLLEFDPLSLKTTWRYNSDPATAFYSKNWGSIFKLDNGNFIVGNSEAGSAFEIDRSGRIVWEWINDTRDAYGLPVPVYRIFRVPKKVLDPIIKVWRDH